MKCLQLALLCTLAARAASLPLAGQGKQVFATSCSVGYCHGIDGRAGKGPRLRDRTWTRTYLYNTIEKGIPGSSMPAWRGRLPDRSIDAVVAYILSIGRQQPDAKGPDTGKEFIPSKQTLSEEAKLGKALFFDPMKDRNCGVCHRIDGSGTPIAAPFGNQSTIKDDELLRQILDSPGRAKTLRVSIAAEEVICGIEAGETRGSLRGSLRIYDLNGSGPPPLRTIALGSVRKTEPCIDVNVHETNSRSYSTPELISVAAFLRSASGLTLP